MKKQKGPEESPMPRIPAGRWYTVAGAMAAAFALVLVASSKYGLGADPDSVAYLSAADNVLAGRGLTLYDGTPFLSWPPLYPWLLAALSAVGLTTREAARYLHAVILAGIVLLYGRWLARHLRNTGLFVIGLLAILLARPLVFVSVFILSEPLFLMLVMGLLSILASPSPTLRLRSLIAASLVAGAAVMTRYVGAAAILAGAILASGSNVISLRRRLARLGIFTATSVLPLAVWLIRNRVTAGSMTGWRQSARVSVIGHLGCLLDTVSLWFFPRVIGFPLRSIMILLLAAAVALILWFAARRSRRSAPGVWPAISVQAVWTGVYLSCVVVLASLVSFNLLQSRLLSPVFPSLLFLLLLAADRGPDLIGRPVIRRAVSFGAAVLMGGWLLLLHLYPDITTIQMSRRFGVGGYSSAGWQETEMADYLRRQPPSGPVYSNAPDALYFLAGRSSQLSPTRKESAPALLGRSGTALIWFNQADSHPGLQDLGSLLRQVPMTPRYFGKDGVVMLSDK